MPQKKLVSVIDTVDKLVDVSIAIKNRMGLKKGPEEGRVDEAFAMLAAGRPPPGCPGRTNRSLYLEYLLRVEQLMGAAGVVISAAGLGVSAVAGMKDRIRVDLPVKMKEREREFAKEVLETIGRTFSAKYPRPSQMTAIAQQVGQSVSSSDASIVRNIEAAATATSQFTGDAYELTWEDVRKIANSGQEVGRVYLIDTYAEAVHSFVIIPISPELTNHFAVQRAKI